MFSSSSIPLTAAVTVVLVANAASAATPSEVLARYVAQAGRPPPRAGPPTVCQPSCAAMGVRLVPNMP
jgi:hypothetical protein